MMGIQQEVLMTHQMIENSHNARDIMIVIPLYRNLVDFIFEILVDLSTVNNITYRSLMSNVVPINCLTITIVFIGGSGCCSCVVNR